MPGFGVNFTYDNKDRLTTIQGQHGTTTNTYDAINRLTSHTDSNGQQVQYQYDAANNVTEVEYPDGKTVTYQYDALNRISDISIDWLSENATPSYDEAGRLTRIVHFNDTSTQYSYDDANRLTGLSHYDGNTLLTAYQYTLDANGNRTFVTINDETIHPPALSSVTHSKTYNTQKNRLLSANTPEAVTFSYDDEEQTETVSGNTTNTKYDFDAAHRLVGYTTASQASNFVYYGSGNRIEATRNGITTQYIYDAGGNLLAEANGTGTIARYYIHGLGLMAFVEAQSGDLYVYHFDGTLHRDLVVVQYQVYALLLELQLILRGI